MVFETECATRPEAVPLDTEEVRFIVRSSRLLAREVFIVWYLCEC
jgi:hypothetical protein